MKRSEMIEMITDYLDLLEEVPQLKVSNEESAEYILSCCELKGMSPPLNVKCNLYDENSPRLLDWEEE